jgi:hypothetical protein
MHAIPHVSLWDHTQGYAVGTRHMGSNLKFLLLGVCAVMLRDFEGCYYMELCLSCLCAMHFKQNLMCGPCTLGWKMGYFFSCGTIRRKMGYAFCAVARSYPLFCKYLKCIDRFIQLGRDQACLMCSFSCRFDLL